MINDIAYTNSFQPIFTLQQSKVHKTANSIGWQPDMDLSTQLRQRVWRFIDQPIVSVSPRSKIFLISDKGNTPANCLRNH
jgi:hypothetical protein